MRNNLLTNWGEVVRACPLSRCIYKFMRKENPDQGNKLVIVDGSSFRTVLNTEWLDNFVINKMMQLFTYYIMKWNIFFPNDQKHFHFCYTDVMADLLEIYEHGQKNFSHWRYSSFKEFLDMEILFIPVNVTNSHWFLIVVWMKQKTIQIFESIPRLRSKRQMYADIVRKWIFAEAVSRLGEEMAEELWSLDDWKVDFKNDAPYQENGYDCGVFVIMNVDFLMSGIPYSKLLQCDMEIYRSLIASHLIRNAVHYSFFKSTPELKDIMNEDWDQEDEQDGDEDDVDEEGNEDEEDELLNELLNEEDEEEDRIALDFN